jgi:RND family efflux transporter MFP subunit
VNIDTVQRGPMPLRLDAVGVVQPVASVSLKTRIDAQIEKIFVSDGAQVKAGEVLVKLDSRQIEAQIKQTEANIAKDQASLEQAQRDAARSNDLFGRGAGTQTKADDALTQVASSKASLAADQALLDNQKVQLSWYTLIAPITGRVGTFSAKAGNIVRSGDNTATGIIGTIVQTSPIYVAFSIPQTALADVREAIAEGRSEVRATPQGGKRSAVGKIAVLDNTIDAATGTIMIRALFDNADDVLWPGQLCNVRVTLRVDPDVISIPRTATQSGQQGNFVFIIENGVALTRKVSVGRFQDGRDIILEGLNGGETIVSDGALLLIDGSRVDIRKETIEKKGAI